MVTPESRIFWDFVNGRPRETSQKRRPNFKALKPPRGKSYHLQHFVVNGGSKSARKAELWQIFAKGDQRKLLEKVGRL